MPRRKACKSRRSRQARLGPSGKAVRFTKAEKATWFVVLLDAEPLRQQAAKEAIAAMKQTEKLKKDLDVFERVALPEFERWKASHFGALLTEQRLLKEKISEHSSFIHELEMRSMLQGISLEMAYFQLTKEQEELRQARECMGGGHPAEEDDDFAKQRQAPPHDPDGWDDNPADLIDEMVRRFFSDFLGLDPDEVPDSVFEDLRNSFQQDADHHGSPPHDQKVHPAKSVPLRIKELYRQLARRLHPDAGADEESVHLWHDLQDAYERGDVDRLEILVALTDLREGVHAADSSLFHLRQAAGEFLRGVTVLQRRLREIRRSPAWKLWKSKDPTPFHKAFDRNLRADLEITRQDCKKLETFLEQIKARAQARFQPKQPHQRRRKKAAPNSDNQGLFDF